jgi:hypothetical protein
MIALSIFHSIYFLNMFFPCFVSEVFGPPIGKQKINKIQIRITLLIDTLQFIHHLGATLR